jgi:hypothetical protein
VFYRSCRIQLNSVDKNEQKNQEKSKDVERKEDIKVGNYYYIGDSKKLDAEIPQQQGFYRIC